jgi:hypothetical protein
MALVPYTKPLLEPGVPQVCRPWLCRVSCPHNGLSCDGFCPGTGRRRYSPNCPYVHYLPPGLPTSFRAGHDTCTRFLADPLAGCCAGVPVLDKMGRQYGIAWGGISQILEKLLGILPLVKMVLDYSHSGGVRAQHEIEWFADDRDLLIDQSRTAFGTACRFFECPFEDPAKRKSCPHPTCIAYHWAERISDAVFVLRGLPFGALVGRLADPIEQIVLH